MTLLSVSHLGVILRGRTILAALAAFAVKAGELVNAGFDDAMGSSFWGNRG